MKCSRIGRLWSIAVSGMLVGCTALVMGCSTDPDVQSDGALSSSSKGGTGSSTAAGSDTGSSYTARKAVDLTNDGRPEAITIDARGPLADSASVTLAILGTAGDTLYQDRWNTRSYFEYTPRNGLTDSAANNIVVGHLQRLLVDSAFTADGPSARLKNAAIPRPPGAKPSPHEVPGIDRDAVRYDIKMNAVGASASPEAVEEFPVMEASIDSLAEELRAMPTFTYYAGGEVTYTVAWSAVKHRFVRIFSCC
jgi:hypothetical protein